MSTFIQEVIAGIEGCGDTSHSVSKESMSAYLKVLSMHSILIERTKKMVGEVYVKKESIDILDTIPQLNCHVIAAAYTELLALANHDVILQHGIIPGVSDEGEGVYCEHSWIKTCDDAIIEAWPIGAMFACPLIYPKGSIRSPFGANLYICSDEDKKYTNDPKIRERVRKLKKLILT